MWPWEHLAFGYLVASGYHRLAGRRPGTAAVLAVGLGSQAPDLIDKPLAWTLSVLPSGLSLGHSVLFAAPVSLLAVAVAARRGRLTVGVAFALAYWSHLVGDVAFFWLTNGSLVVGFLLWPLVETGPETGIGFLTTVGRLADRFLAFLGTPRGRLYLLLEATLLGSALLAWARDGWPGLTAVRSRLRGDAGGR